jgi:pimeloyl-ACP methyl ester carboxylesterase
MSLVTLSDGYRLNVEEVGDGFPLILLHGGPGLDHTMFRPWLDALADEFRLLYVDERGQGRSERVDPSTLTLGLWAQDVDLLADALGLDRFALLGHSFGAMIATTHAIEHGTAAGYIISAGGDSSAALDADVSAALAALGDDGSAIAQSWEDEKTVRTEAEFAALMEAQMPFHFAGVVPPDFGAATLYAPEVLRHVASMGYGEFDYRPQLERVSKPTLLIVGEHDRTTPTRASRVLHEGIRDSELVVLPGVGHMSYVEAPDEYVAAVRGFLRQIA